MVKILTDKFKIGKSKRGKELDLVTAVTGKDYEAKFNEVYSTSQSDREKYERLLNRYSDGEILKQENKNYSKGFRRAAATLAAIVGLGFASCGGGVGDPNDYKEPPVDNPDDGDDDDPVEPIPDTDYVDISGKLQDCETDTNQTGYIVVRNRTDNSIIGTYQTNGSAVDGNFGFSLPKKVSELPDGIILEARLGPEGNETSYRRTIELPAGDHNPIIDPRGNPAIRCVPYDNPNDSYDDGLLDTPQKREDFIKHMRRVNFNGLIDGNYSLGKLKKWNHGERTDIPQFKGYAIYYPHFTNEEQIANIKKSIKESEHINADWIGRDGSYVGEENDGGVVLGTVGQFENGWISIREREESSSGMNSTILYDSDMDGYIERATVYLEPTNICEEGFKSVMIHELVGHGLLFPGHADNGVNNGQLFPTNMTYTDAGRTPTLSPADKKGNYLVDEETYLGMESEEDILGL